MIHTRIVYFLGAFMFLCCAPQQEKQSRDFVCTELHAPDFGKPLVVFELMGDTLQPPRTREDSVKFYAVALRTNKWSHDSNTPLTITVCFLNGTDWQKQKVKQYADVWSKASAYGKDPLGKPGYKIQFVYTDHAPTSQVRVYFDNSGRSDSYVGMECLDIDKDKYTTRFGWLDPSYSEAEIRAVILHEFGHVVGLSHEHQNPAVTIPWDKEAVYNYYATQYQPAWSRDEVDRNIFIPEDARFSNYTTWDSASIMHYPIPASWTIGHAVSVAFNTVLSKTDSAFIKDQYRYYACTIGESCCWNRAGKKIPCP